MGIYFFKIVNNWAGFDLTHNPWPMDHCHGYLSMGYLISGFKFEFKLKLI